MIPTMIPTIIPVATAAQIDDRHATHCPTLRYSSACRRSGYTSSQCRADILHPLASEKQYRLVKRSLLVSQVTEFAVVDIKMRMQHHRPLCL
jgi:hypothetical protein